MFFASSCSDIDPHYVGSTLLNALIENIPDACMPIVTTENSENYCLQMTLKRAEEVEYLRTAYEKLFIRIRQEWNGPVLEDGEYRWTWVHDDGVNRTTFRIVPGDSLHFSLNHTGSVCLWSPFNGWVSSTSRTGLIEFIDFEDWGFRWRSVSEGLYMGTDGLGKSYAVFDSLDGGGVVDVIDIGLCCRIFSAGWDNNGHGWCGDPCDGNDW